MYFDLQVNGYAGADFNGDQLTDDQLLEACRRLRDDGVAGILATVITDEIPAMCRRLARLARARQQHAPVRELICGFHIEGPFLNAQPGYVGAHRPDATCDADRDKLQQLLDAAGGAARVVTLAPERDPARTHHPLAGRSRRGRRRRTLRSHTRPTAAPLWTRD